MELTPILDRDGDQPLYMQLYRYIRGCIEDGMIATGMRLPSIRTLGAHLNVSKITVETAYQQLVAEGYAESRERSGLRVLPLERAPEAGIAAAGEGPALGAAWAAVQAGRGRAAVEIGAAPGAGGGSAVQAGEVPATPGHGAGRAARIAGSTGLAGEAAAAASSAPGHDAGQAARIAGSTGLAGAGGAPLDAGAPYPAAPAAAGPALAGAPISAGEQRHAAITHDFQYGDIELERFPLKAWRACLQSAFDGDLGEVLGYGDNQGEYGLRAEISRYLQQSRGVKCSPEQIVLTAGTQQSIALLCRLLPLSGQTVAMEEPGYNGVRVTFADHGCKLVPIAVEADGIAVDELERTNVTAAVYVTPSHQFPMGGVMAVQKRRQLIQWATRSGALIIEDDYDSEFRYVGQPIPALQALDQDGRVIYLGTLSKSFLPAIRMSYMVLPKPIAEAITERIGQYSSPVSPILQRAVRHFMEKGHMERHVRRMRRLYQMKHRQLMLSLHARMGDRVGIIGPKAGLHLLLDVHGRSRGELLARAEAAGIRVYSPERHWSVPSECPASLILVGFGGLHEDAIEEGISRLAVAWFGIEQEGHY